MDLDQYYDYAHKADADDPLRLYREQFRIPERKGVRQIYFLGNSLGLQPVTTAQKLEEVLQQWAGRGVEAFFEGRNPWLGFHDQLRPMLATIVGAVPAEITVMNQLTVNLHLLLASFYRPVGKKIKILTEAKAFPSDQYMLETHIRHRGYDPDTVWLEVAPRAGEHHIHEEDIIAAIRRNADELALVFFGGVNYYTGQVFDMKAIAAAAREMDIPVGFDLAHAAGNVPLQLHDWNVDFAAWCNYKYLNAGPGAVASAFIHQRHHGDSSIPRLAGWWGYNKATRFDMKKGFEPIPDAEGWQLSTPSPLLYASLLASLEIFENAGWEKLQEKQGSLRNFARQQLEIIASASNGEITILTPDNSHCAGAQFSLLFRQQGRRIFEALSDKGFMVDWREPNCIRFAAVPLYNQHTEIWNFAQTLRELLMTEAG